MQFKTKLGLVDIPNEDVLAAFRDIMSSAQAPVEDREASQLVGSDAVVVVRRSSAAALLSRWDEDIEQRKREAGMMTCADLVRCAKDLRRLLASRNERQPQHKQVSRGAQPTPDSQRL